MFDTYVMPFLRKYATEILVSRNVNITGLGESTVEARLPPYGVGAQPNRRALL